MEATENLSSTEESKSQTALPKYTENLSSTEESKSQTALPKYTENLSSTEESKSQTAPPKATENLFSTEESKSQTALPKATENLFSTEESKSQNVPPKTTENLFSTEEFKSQNIPPKVAVGGLHDVYKDFTKTSINVVQKAASILEEEVAAGIIAAKKVEDHFVDTDKLRYGRPEEVMSRFRLDVHEVLDIMIDLVNVTMNSMYSISKNVVKIRSSSNKTRPEQTAFGQLPVITTPQPIKAGYSCEIPLFLENSSDKPTDEFNLYCTELVSASGERILASQISFTPSSIKIDLRSAEKVIVTINVPEETKTGVYSGLVSATNLSQLRSIITIKVD